MTINTDISTQPFKLTPATYFKIAAGAKLPTLLTTALLALFISTTLAVIIDLRILLIGLILIFLVIPFITLHIYYNTLLTADAQYAIARKSITFHSDGSITETFLPVDESGSEQEQTIPETRTFTTDQILNIRQTSQYTILTIIPNYQLIIPKNTISK